MEIDLCFLCESAAARQHNERGLPAFFGTLGGGLPVADKIEVIRTTRAVRDAIASAFHHVARANAHPHTRLIFLPPWSPRRPHTPSRHHVLHRFRRLAALAFAEAAADELTQPYLPSCRPLSAERTQHTVLPAREDQFSALAACNFEDVRVVILGQDPYPTPDTHMASPFRAANCGRPLPAQKHLPELYDDLQIPPAEHGCLTSWADQAFCY